MTSFLFIVKIPVEDTRYGNSEKQDEKRATEEDQEKDEPTSSDDNKCDDGDDKVKRKEKKRRKKRKRKEKIVHADGYISDNNDDTVTSNVSDTTPREKSDTDKYTSETSATSSDQEQKQKEPSNSDDSSEKDKSRSASEEKDNTSIKSERKDSKSNSSKTNLIEWDFGEDDPENKPLVDKEDPIPDSDEDVSHKKFEVKPVEEPEQNTLEKDVREKFSVSELQEPWKASIENSNKVDKQEDITEDGNEKNHNKTEHEREENNVEAGKEKGENEDKAENGNGENKYTDESVSETESEDEELGTGKDNSGTVSSTTKKSPKKTFAIQKVDDSKTPAVTSEGKALKPNIPGDKWSTASLSKVDLETASLPPNKGSGPDLAIDKGHVSLSDAQDILKKKVNFVSQMSEVDEKDLHHFLEKTTLLEDIEDILHNYNLENYTVLQTQNGKYFQVMFVDEGGERCERILNSLTAKGFGEREGTTISIYPSSVYKGKIKEPPSESDEEGSEKQDGRHSRTKFYIGPYGKFIQSSSHRKPPHQLD